MKCSVFQTKLNGLNSPNRSFTSGDLASQRSPDRVRLSQKDYALNSPGGDNQPAIVELQPSRSPTRHAIEATPRDSFTAADSSAPLAWSFATACRQLQSAGEHLCDCILIGSFIPYATTGPIPIPILSLRRKCLPLKCLQIMDSSRYRRFSQRQCNHIWSLLLLESLLAAAAAGNPAQKSHRWGHTLAFRVGPVYNSHKTIFG